CADKAAAHIGEYAFRFAVERMTVAPAPAGLDAHDVATTNDRAVADRGNRALFIAAGIDHAATGATLPPAFDAPRREVDPVDAHRHPCRGRQDLEPADEAAAAAPTAGTAGIGVDRIAKQPDGIDGIEKFGRIILLGDEIDRVVAVRERPRAI